MVQYRPILIAKRGELTALGAIPAAVVPSLQPVLQAPPREWDFDAGVWKKSVEHHLQDFPKKVAAATRGHAAFIDVSLLDTVAPIFGGRHPLTWIVEEAATHGLELTPFVGPGSAAATIAAAADIHARLGRGVGLRLPTDDWVSIDARRLPRLLSMLGVTSSEVDLFVDVAREFGPLTTRGILTELDSQDAAYTFRTRTIGGAAFPDTQGMSKGLSEFAREDWLFFREAHRARAAAGSSTPDFFDNAVQNPSVDVGGVNPRMLSISALFRYTADEQWLIAKGELFKGSGGRGLGSAAMLTPLTLLVAHPKYTVPIRTATDDWIDSVVAGTQNGGNAEVWRRWATQRHLTVVAHQLSSPI